MPTKEDEQFMWRCLHLAASAEGSVSPNPMVGAVLVYQQRIIGEGCHEIYGGAHAEVNCINSVAPGYQELISSSTMYVSLEPCAHHGKTPPCADLIIRHGIRRVVTGSRDPNPLVSGRGVAKMRSAGIDVTEQVLKTECDFLNRRFISYHSKQRPYIILKWAVSADGFFAPFGSNQQWFTNNHSKMLVHKWRGEEDAVLVGASTACIDNPQLSNRLWPGKNPVRLLIDPHLRVTEEKHIFDEQAMTIVYNLQKEGLERGTLYVKTDLNNLPDRIAADLYRRKIMSVIIEGGAFTLNAFIAADRWDEARIFTGAEPLGDGIKGPSIVGKTWEEIKIGGDRLLIIERNS